MGNILYAKKYPDPDSDPEPDSGGPAPAPNPEPPLSENGHPSRDKAGALIEGLTFVEIPGRRDGAELFIAAVKELCDACEYDIKIIELPYGILAELSMDSDSYSDGRLNQLIGMAHDISLLSCVNDRDVTLRLYYVTMNIFRGGQRFYPQPPPEQTVSPVP